MYVATNRLLVTQYPSPFLSPSTFYIRESGGLGSGQLQWPPRKLLLCKIKQPQRSTLLYKSGVNIWTESCYKVAGFAWLRSTAVRRDCAANGTTRQLLPVVSPKPHGFAPESVGQRCSNANAVAFVQDAIQQFVRTTAIALGMTRTEGVENTFLLW